MNIKRAKEEIEHTVKAYLAKDALGEYAIPAIRQRPILLMGPPGIGKTQVMEQVARECGVALVAYTAWAAARGTTAARVSTSASRMALMVPKCFRSSARRFSPTPGIPSRAERVALLLWLSWW